MLLSYLLEQPGAHASPKGVIEHQQRKLLLGIPREPGEAQAYMHLLYVLFHRPEAFFLYELVLWLSDLKADIEDYHNKSKTIRSSNVCDSNDVVYQTVDGRECAYVTASYFMNENNSFDRTNEMYVLRKDDDGDWKILVFYQVEGDSSDEQ